LGLSDTCLCHIVLSQIFAECIFNLFFFESNQFARNSFIVICEAYKSQLQFLLSLEALELRITERAGQLPCTVRAEVEEDYGILILNGCNRMSIFFHNGRNYKLIGLSFVVGSLYCLSGIRSLYAFSFGQSFVCQLYTIPAVVTVHRIITSGYNADLSNAQLIHFLLQLFDITF